MARCGTHEARTNVVRGDGLTASNDVLIRSVGARDVGLGMGLAADPSPASMWLKAGILAAIVVAGAALLVRNRVPRKELPDRVSRRVSVRAVRARCHCRREGETLFGMTGEKRVFGPVHHGRPDIRSYRGDQCEHTAAS